MHTSCPSCSASYDVAPAAAGKTAKCGTCGHQFVIVQEEVLAVTNGQPVLARTQPPAPARESGSRGMTVTLGFAVCAGLAAVITVAVLIGQEVMKPEVAQQIAASTGQLPRVSPTTAAANERRSQVAEPAALVTDEPPAPVQAILAAPLEDEVAANVDTAPEGSATTLAVIEDQAPVAPAKRSPPEKHPRGVPGPAEPRSSGGVIEISITDLAKAYKNELTADPIYRGKRLRIADPLSLIYAGYLGYRDELTETLAMCKFSRGQLDGLVLGHLTEVEVTIEGTCRGIRGQGGPIELDDCVLVTSRADILHQFQEVQARRAADKERAEDELEATARTGQAVRPHPARGFVNSRGQVTITDGKLVEMTGIVEEIQEIGNNDRLYFTDRDVRVQSIGGEITGTLYEVTLRAEKFDATATCYFRAKHRPKIAELDVGQKLTVRGFVQRWGSRTIELRYCTIVR